MQNPGIPLDTKGIYNRGEKPQEKKLKNTPRPSPKKNEKIGGSEPFAHAVRVLAEFCLFLLGKECSADKLLELRLKLLVPSNRNPSYGESRQMVATENVWFSLLWPLMLLASMIHARFDSFF